MYMTRDRAVWNCVGVAGPEKTRQSCPPMFVLDQEIVGGSGACMVETKTDSLYAASGSWFQQTLTLCRCVESGSKIELLDVLIGTVLSSTNSPSYVKLRLDGPFRSIIGTSSAG